MTMDELFQLHKSGLKAGEIILDVRDDDEYREGHVPGAINIPVDAIGQRFVELKKFTKIYVHCGGGGRAGRATEALIKNGISNVVHICNSGMRSWLEKGYTIEK